MPARGRSRLSSSTILFATLLAYFPGAELARAQPQAHHPGEWTPAILWPGTATGVQAVHMALVRGDTLFGMPHSRVLAWGSWEPALPENGGLWSWNPVTDVGAAALTNLSKQALNPPAFSTFCAGHTTLPSASGDLLIVGGTDRGIAGVAKSLRLDPQSGSWRDPAGTTMNSRRWYGVGTAMPWSDGSWRILATAGFKYEHMAVFGGRRADNGALTSDVERYQITTTGAWDAPVSGNPPNWPEPREYATLAEQGTGPHYLFGGRDAIGLRGDVWQLLRNDMRVNESVQTYVFNPLTPAPVAAVPVVGVPASRWRHTAVVDAGSGPGGDAKYSTMYLFGGEDANGQPLGDLWKLWWDPAPPGKWKWSLLSATGTPPSARSGATAVWDEPGNRLIVFGGEGAAGALADNAVYVLDTPGTSPTWRVATPAGDSDAPPAARALHAMGVDAFKRVPPGHSDADSWFHTVVFGGDLATGSTVSPTNQYWELFVQPGTGSVIWKNRTPASGPAARTGASVVVYERYPASAVVTGGELAGGAADPGAWEIPLAGGPWTARPALGHALKGQVALREHEPVTALQPEVYDENTNTWQAYGNSKYQFSYHMMFAGSDGGLWYAGPNFWGEEKTWRFDPGTGVWTQQAITGNGFDQCATGVLYRPNRILKVGEIGAGEVALPLTSSLMLGESLWRLPAQPLALARQFHNVTVLPTGEVIATGGMEKTLDNDGNPENDNPRRRPELWDPDYTQGALRGAWYGAGAGEAVQLAQQTFARGHHSSALVLPDGRILAGGGHDTDPAAQIRSVDAYSPPYLYRAGGAAAFRPRLYGAQDHIAWNQDFAVACPDPVVAACLIRPGAATHTFNQDQRYVPLALVGTQAGHHVTLHAPANASEAPPGNYLLFVLALDPVSGKQVPSIARWVNVGPAQTTYATWDTLPPAAVSTLHVSDVTATTHTLQWYAPADAGDGSSGHAGRYELRYRRAQQMPTLAEFFASGTAVVSVPTPAAAGVLQSVTVTGLTPLGAGELYYFRLISRDEAGSGRNWSALSNQAETPEGGGCPFVDVATPEGWREENSILGRSLSGALALDGYRLRNAPDTSGGVVRLRVRENEQELTTLDQVRLIAIDHAPGLRAYAVGDRVLLGWRVPAVRVTTPDGRDLTALLAGTGTGYLGEPGDTLDVELAASGPAGALGATRTAEGDPFIDGDGGKGGGGGRATRAPGAMSAEAVDALVLGTTGIRIEAPDGAGGWAAVAHRYPREHYDEAVFDSLTGDHLRLVFVGRHRLNFVGRLRLGGEAFTATKLPLLAASHTRLGEVSGAIDTTGNLTTELAPGDTVSLQFGWTAVPAGQERELLLLSRGVYTANLPARLRPLPPQRFAFLGVRPNPFTAATTLRFALPAAAHVRLEVLDAQGRRVALLANGERSAGEHALEWDGRTEAGASARPGVYFYRLAAGEHRAQGKLTRLP